jgi:hypothetical protein
MADIFFRSVVTKLNIQCFATNLCWHLPWQDSGFLLHSLVVPCSDKSNLPIITSQVQNLLAEKWTELIVFSVYKNFFVLLSLNFINSSCIWVPFVNLDLIHLVAGVYHLWEGWIWFLSVQEQGEEIVTGGHIEAMFWGVCVCPLFFFLNFIELFSCKTLTIWPGGIREVVELGQDTWNSFICSLTHFPIQPLWTGPGVDSGLRWTMHVSPVLSELHPWEVRQLNK